MKKQLFSQKKRARWLGEAADKKILLEHFERSFMKKPLPDSFHYAFTYPGEKRCAELLYTLRICRFEVPDGEALKIRGAFNGIVGTRDIYDGDILCGSYNATTEPVDPMANFGGFSIVFHTHHVRLHYVRLQNGEIAENIHYYTDKPVDGALQMICLALDIVIHDIENDRDAICRPLTEALIRQLYCELLHSFHTTANESSKLARKIKYHLECNFAENINCSLICDELEINRSHASQIFHRNFGITMSDYLTNLRIDAAKKLLASSDKLKIAEIASLCGFPDSRYFSRVFHRCTGKTPLEYRKSPVKK